MDTLEGSPTEDAVVSVVELDSTSELELKGEDEESATVVDGLETAEEVEEAEDGTTDEGTRVVVVRDEEVIVRELVVLVEEGAATRDDEDEREEDDCVELGDALGVVVLLLGDGVLVGEALDGGEGEEAGEEDEEAAGSDRDDASEVSLRGRRDASRGKAAHRLLSPCSLASLWTTWRSKNCQLEMLLPHLERCSGTLSRHSSSRSWRSS